MVCTRESITDKGFQELQYLSKKLQLDNHQNKFHIFQGIVAEQD